ncbi:MAG TPA: hypothetical protein VL574_10080 [Stellaceae bacterium]|jgi:hypothetical protein|nr:hypothetical protein [Stellaceae bacterium]
MVPIATQKAATTPRSLFGSMNIDGTCKLFGKIGSSKAEFLKSIVFEGFSFDRRQGFTPDHH